MGYYIHTVVVFVIGNTIRKAVVTVMIGNYIHRVVVIEGSLFSREYGMYTGLVPYILTIILHMREWWILVRLIGH